MDWHQVDGATMVGFRGAETVWMCSHFILVRWNVPNARGWFRYDRTGGPDSPKRKLVGSGGQASAEWTPAEAARKLIGPDAAEGFPAEE